MVAGRQDGRGGDGPVECQVKESGLVWVESLGGGLGIGVLGEEGCCCLCCIGVGGGEEGAGGRECAGEWAACESNTAEGRHDDGFVWFLGVRVEEEDVEEGDGEEYGNHILIRQTRSVYAPRSSELPQIRGGGRGAEGNL